MEIVTEGGWETVENMSEYPEIPSLMAEHAPPAELPDSLQKQFIRLTEMDKLMTQEPGSAYERSFVSAALKSFEAYRYRRAMETGPGYFRPNAQPKKEAMIMVYANAAAGMYRGFETLMQGYAHDGSAEQKKLASIFFKLQ